MRNNQIFFPHQDNLLELYFQELNSDEIILVINKHYSQFPVDNPPKEDHRFGDGRRDERSYANVLKGKAT